MYWSLLFIPLMFGFASDTGDSWQTTFCHIGLIGTLDFLHCNKLQDTFSFEQGSNITIELNNSTNAVKISASGGNSPNELFCSGTDKFRAYNTTSNTFECATDTTSSNGVIYENNTQSSPTHANTLVLAKNGVNLPIKGIACIGLLCTTNSTDITLNVTAVTDTNTAQIASAGGTSLFKSRDNATQNTIKGLTSGTGISLASNTNDIQISSTIVDTDTNTAQIASAGGTTLFKSRDNATQNTIKGLTTTKGITLTGNTNDVNISTNFQINSLTCGANNFFSAFSNTTGVLTCTLPLNTAQIASAGGTSLFKSRDNATQNTIKGLTTTKGITLTGNTNDVNISTNFQANTITCSGTDKISAYNNQTGLYTCTTDTSGATARENLVGHFEMDRTWTNIGTSMVDVYTTSEGVRIDTNGMTTATLQIQWTKIGVGTQKCQIVDVTTPTNILITYNNLASGLNTNATVTIPAGLANTIKTYKPQCLSSTSTDDPVWLSASLLLR